MKALDISDDLSLPIDAATQTFAFIARKGAGKTYAAGKLAECLIDAGVQVVVLDSVGNWWGLRLTADGKEAAYDIPVIGGLRGDIPLEATGGKLIADTIVETGRSLIIDVSQFSKASRQKFAYEFGERLWLKKKAERNPSPVHLIIEESQLIIPENTSGKDHGALMVGIYEEIIRLGRNFGIGVSMISQRPQSVNKEVLNQAECLVCLQVNGAHERKALQLWITHQGLEKGLVDELPSLPIGTAYIWSPQWLQILKKVRIGTKKTFDASATPKVGSHQVRRDLKPLQLDDLQERMSATIEKAKQEDPKELRRQIAELKKAKGVPDAASIERAVAKAVDEAQRDYQRVQQEQMRAINDLRGRLDKIAALAHLNGNAPAIAEYKPIAPRVVVDRPAPQPRVSHSIPQDEGSGDLSRMGRKMLTALAQHPAGLSKAQILLHTDYRSSGPVSKEFASLARDGYVTPSGTGLQITDAGLSALGDYEPLPTGSELREFLLSGNKLNTMEKALMRQITDAFPEPISKGNVLERASYASSGPVSKAFARLVRYGYAVKSGSSLLRASEELFD